MHSFNVEGEAHAALGRLGISAMTPDNSISRPPHGSGSA
jgi:hypothetical protein